MSAFNEHAIEYRVTAALWDNNVSKIQKILKNSSTCPFTPFKLMQEFIAMGRNNVEMWNYLIPLLSKEQMTETFLIPESELTQESGMIEHGESEHTLLTLLCSKNVYANLEYKLKDLITRGSDLNQLVGERKRTALSYLVRSDENIDLIKLCISMGANPSLGHLLVNASRFVSEEEYNYIKESLPSYRSVDLGKFYNLNIFKFLLEDLRLDYDDVESITGVTPLLAACSEETIFNGGCTIEKVSMLLEKEANMYVKTTAGIGIFEYACRQYRNQMFSMEYDLYTVLAEAQYDERIIWEERLSMCSEGTLLDTFPVQQVLLPFFTML